MLYARYGATLTATNHEEIHECLLRLESCKTQTWWDTKTIPTVWHLLSQYHVFGEEFMGMEMDLQLPLSQFKEDADTIHPITNHGTNDSTLAPQSLDYEVEAVDLLCETVQQNTDDPVLVIDHTAAVDVEPVLERILRTCENSEVHLVARGDREISAYPSVSLFDKETVREVSSLITNKYSSIIVLTESKLLLSKKVKCFVGSVQAKSRYVVETTGEVVPYGRSELLMDLYSDLSGSIVQWASKQVGRERHS